MPLSSPPCSPGQLDTSKFLGHCLLWQSIGHLDLVGAQYANGCFLVVLLIRPAPLFTEQAPCRSRLPGLAQWRPGELRRPAFVTANSARTRQTARDSAILAPQSCHNSSDPNSLPVHGHCWPFGGRLSLHRPPKDGAAGCYAVQGSAPGSTHLVGGSACWRRSPRTRSGLPPHVKSSRRIGVKKSDCFSNHVHLPRSLAPWAQVRPASGRGERCGETPPFTPHIKTAPASLWPLPLGAVATDCLTGPRLPAIIQQEETG